MGGLLSRVIYEAEMDVISKLWGRKTSNPESSRQEAENRFIHLLRFFAFRNSTPHATVSRTMRKSFFTGPANDCTGLRLLSTVGVKPSTEVRCYNEERCGFLRTIPYLKPHISSLAESSHTHDAPIRQVDTADILYELRSRTLDEEEMIKCLKWRLSLDSSVVEQDRQSLEADFLAAAKVLIPAGVTKTKREVSLATISTVCSPSNGVIKDSPLPRHTLPARLAEALPLDKLLATFSWKALALSDWLQFLVVDGVDIITDDFRIDRSTSFAQQVFAALAAAWGSTSPSERNRIKSVLKNVFCIPTDLGSQKPSDSYLPGSGVFSGLPIALLPDAEKEGPLRRVVGVDQRPFLRRGC